MQGDVGTVFFRAVGTRNDQPLKSAKVSVMLSRLYLISEVEKVQTVATWLDYLLRSCQLEWKYLSTDRCYIAEGFRPIRDLTLAHALNAYSSTLDIHQIILLRLVINYTIPIIMHVLAKKVKSVYMRFCFSQVIHLELCCISLHSVGYCIVIVVDGGV